MSNTDTSSPSIEAAVAVGAEKETAAAVDQPAEAAVPDQPAEVDAKDDGEGQEG